MKQKQNKKERKNIKGKIISNTITGVLVAVIISGIGVGAVTLFASSDVVYDNSNSGATSTNVQGALDELYELANNQDYYDPYAVGRPVYYNPVSGAKCFDYVSDNSLNENKTGCMKWYIIGSGTDTVDMILDHNTTYKGYWITSTDYGSTTTYNDKGPITLLKKLHTDTDGWTGVPTRTDSYTDSAYGYTINYNGYRARLIEANEIAKITGADKALQWDSAKIYTDGSPTIGTNISYYYLDGKYGTKSKWRTQVASSQGASKYAWLYDYTKNCTSYGCNIEDSNVGFGYWTSSASEYGNNVMERNKYVYVIKGGGKLELNVHNQDSYYNSGLRPVITIPKP